jgi:serine/threonine protein kinase
MSAILSSVIKYPPTPAERLLGLSTSAGWVITELVRSVKLNTAGMTGSNFSVGYTVERINPKTGKVEYAFLKALDVDKTLRNSVDLLNDLRSKLNEFAFEKQMHEFCRDRHMSRIVRVIEAGDLVPAQINGDRINQVPFLVLEIADHGDARSWVNKISGVETVLKLSYLHHVLGGLQQLHKATIAHSDLKPSNIMIFRNDGAKIGDLGRVINGVGNCPFSSLEYPGDYSYAPPEILYRASQAGWVDGRERVDLFQWGALCVYLFSGVDLNTWLKTRLDAAVSPQRWGGAGPSYTVALPYLIDAFEEVLSELGSDAFPEWASDSLISLVRETAHPDYSKRGDASFIKRFPNMTGLDRLITRSSILVKRGEVQIRINDNATKSDKANNKTS